MTEESNKQKQPAENATMTFMGKELVKQGVGNNGEWKLWKLKMLREGRDQTNTFKAFGNAKKGVKVEEMVEGNKYFCMYQPDTYEHPQHGTVRTNTIFFINNPKESQSSLSTDPSSTPTASTEGKPLPSLSPLSGETGFSLTVDEEQAFTTVTTDQRYAAWVEAAKGNKEYIRSIMDNFSKGYTCDDERLNKLHEEFLKRC